MYNIKQIGTVIANWRRGAGLTQEELAQQLHITSQAVSKWENGTGLPDITLLPRLAEVMHLSIDTLMGVESAELHYPERYQGLPLTYFEGSQAVYSNKELAGTEGDAVLFTDGSRACLRENRVINVGAGEIRIVRQQDVSDSVDGNEPGTPYERAFEAIVSLRLRISGCCGIRVLAGDGPTTEVYAEGQKSFLDGLTVSREDRLLNVQVEPRQNRGNGVGNRITIRCGFSRGERLDVQLNGSGDLEVQPNFAGAALSICGSGDITAADLGDCAVAISGSGDIHAGTLGRCEIRIAGSGDVHCRSMAGGDVRISGSGSIQAETVSGGELCAQISGSGDLQFGGELDRLTLISSGSGTLQATKLTVGDVVLHADGSGSAVIGRILHGSEERLSKNYVFRVLQRG